MRGLAILEYVLVAVSLGTMSVITFANVLSRYLFHTSFSFAEEITINLFVLMTFVGASIAIKQQAHFGFRFIYDKLSGMWKRVALAATCLVMIVFLSCMFYFSMELVLAQAERGRVTPALSIPQWLFTSAIPLGSLLCFIRTVEMWVTESKRLTQGGEKQRKVEMAAKEVNR
ncbi:TRAP transporter small permease [Shouchella clausii]|uniref:TRAP transporter small permease n=1 Tax=Shouchella TaxID=2893057 RepID=UPI0004E72CBF|nr:MULTISPECIES: TRAP transporter small permease [Shouchella]ALA53428.1 TRAP-type C4-dicarboxylate transport system, small permease component [Shouchella clausii]MBU3229978.1 TRAP transporter small permease [Shouchella clausii]MBU3263938.1 TRAP transporter small permease [Shouchella clausii]MBU3509200.1 TRAP transporter small permease [Shouchella clausii]MBU3534811.1 TRAP transporter small permease [Shouchella clausii]